MDNQYLITKDSDGRWITKRINDNNPLYVYPTKKTALEKVRDITGNKAVIIVHGLDGKVSDVIGPAKEYQTIPIKPARVTHRRANVDVNIAIAEALEQQMDTENAESLER